MAHNLAILLDSTVTREAAQLRNISDADATASTPAQTSWTRKEELGHLIDSASNNHIRFVRATISEFKGPGYEQDRWVALHGYQELPWPRLIDLWQQYNWLLTELVRRIPEDRLSAECVVGNEPQATLRFLIEDYVLHMQHHLDRILAREVITQYPAVATA